MMVDHFYGIYKKPFYFTLFLTMSENKLKVDYKEETKIETLTDEHDRITVSSLESQEHPQLKRSLKSRHLAVNFFIYFEGNPVSDYSLDDFYWWCHRSRSISLFGW